MEFKPLHENHAIESVTFGVEWQQPLSPNIMATLETVYGATIKDELPSKKPLQRIAFKIDPARGAEVAPPVPQGWLFERFEADGRVSHRMQLSLSSLVVTSFVYERWRLAFEKAMHFMRPFLPLISVSTGGVSAFVLECADVFICFEKDDNFNSTAIFRQESNRLPSIIFDQKDLWHAHHGYFTNVEGEPSRRRLTTANIDLIKEDEIYKLRILSTHRTIFSAFLSDPNVLDSDNALISTEMEAMHTDNKLVLRDLLNDEALEMINLRTLNGME